MKIAMFNTREQKAEHFNRLADAVEQNGLRQAVESYERAKAGRGKAEFLKTNNIPADKQDAEWEHHIEWLKGEVLFLKRKVRKYRREAQA